MGTPCRTRDAAPRCVGLAHHVVRPSEATMRTFSAVRMCLVVAAFSVWAFAADGAPPAPTPSGGDAEAQKLVTAAMDVDYLKMNFDAAKKKLSQAALTC